MFVGLWHIVKKLSIPLHDSLKDLSVNDYPYTVTFLIKRRMQIDSYLELPEDKRPPKSLWDSPSKLDEWFDRVFDHKKQTEFSIPLDENELEH